MLLDEICPSDLVTIRNGQGDQCPDRACRAAFHTSVIMCSAIHPSRSYVTMGPR